MPNPNLSTSTTATAAKKTTVATNVADNGTKAATKTTTTTPTVVKPGATNKTTTGVTAVADTGTKAATATTTPKTTTTTTPTVVKPSAADILNSGYTAGTSAHNAASTIPSANTVARPVADTGTGGKSAADIYQSTVSQRPDVQNLTGQTATPVTDTGTGTRAPNTAQTIDQLWLEGTYSKGDKGYIDEYAAAVAARPDAQPNSAVIPQYTDTATRDSAALDTFNSGATAGVSSGSPATVAGWEQNVPTSGNYVPTTTPTIETLPPPNTPVDVVPGGAAADLINSGAYPYNYAPYPYPGIQLVPAFGETELPSANTTVPTTATTVTSDYTPPEKLSWLQQEIYDNMPQYSSELEAKINSMMDLQREQAATSIDYATQQAINSLNRQYEDSLSQFDQLRAQNEYQSKVAADNLALIQARNGERGGIGNKQYSDQQASFDQALLAIDLQQMQLKTDIERQVTDYIAKGEYDKAQATYEIGIAQMQALIDQQNLILNYSMNLASNIDSLNASQNEADRSYFLQKLQMGMLNADDAAALGVDPAQAQAYADRINLLAQIDTAAAQMQLESQIAALEAAKRGGSGGGGSSSANPFEQYSSPYDALYYGFGAKTEGEAYATLLQAGYSSTEAAKMAGYYATMVSNYNTQAQKDYIASVQPYITNQLFEDGSVMMTGGIKISGADLQNGLNNGTILIEEYPDGRQRYVWQNAYTQQMLHDDNGNGGR